MVALKLDTDGDYGWHTFYGSGSSDSGRALAVDGAGGLYLAGRSDASWDGPAGQDPLHAHSGGGDLVVLKLADRLYVDQDATAGANDGSSWADAFTHLQDALDPTAAGYEIWVAEGVYTPNWMDFTLAAWVNWGGVAPWQRIFDFGHEPDSGQDPSHYMFLTPRSISDTLRFAITTGSWSAEEQLNYTSPLTPSQWVHLAVTLAGDTGTLYVDGQPVDTQTITLDPRDVVGPNMWLGRSQWSWDPYFDGLMDEVAVFNRALNAAEIADVYQSGWGAQPGQVLGLHFNETAGATTFDDASGNYNDAWCEAGSCPTAGVASGAYSPALEFTGTLTHYVSLPATIPRSTTFQLVDGVALYGGFAGSETSRGQRDWQNNVTVLSGDLDGDDQTDAHGVITHTDYISGTNAYHVVTSHGLTETAVLDGFTLTGGNANGDYPNDSGGGMFNEDSSPTVRNVTFSGNTADWGGGMRNDFSNNPTLVDVTFCGNTADEGGGMANSGSHPALTNVTFNGNTATWHGGGVWNYDSNPTLTNVTFSGNTAMLGDGGGMYNELSSPALTNCILWGDTPNQIYNLSDNSSTISYSDIQGSGGSGPGWDSNLGIDGGGNIDADPQFVDADGPDDVLGTPDDNLRLQLTSPAIDAGDNTAPGLVGVTTDLGGHSRFVDVPSVPDTGVGPAPIVDMGACEAQDVSPAYLPLILKQHP
jgi:hypothetical protein